MLLTRSGGGGTRIRECPRIPPQILGGLRQLEGKGISAYIYNKSYRCTFSVTNVGFAQACPNCYKVLRCELWKMICKWSLPLLVHNLHKFYWLFLACAISLVCPFTVYECCLLLRSCYNRWVATTLLHCHTSSQQTKEEAGVAGVSYI